jgi:hypothetical protein
MERCAQEVAPNGLFALGVGLPLHRAGMDDSLSYFSLPNHNCGRRWRQMFQPVVLWSETLWVIGLAGSP